MYDFYIHLDIQYSSFEMQGSYTPECEVLGGKPAVLYVTEMYVIYSMINLQDLDRI